ncbi:HTH-type transcriptional regulator [Clostridioides difficile]|uniref:helix-turn-helix domain-containing protein n=1 Tax=Clostridioides difficile TaxID=1496 RepID=UPI0010276C00|nr:helix-turn-helix transcriptional regulator [Clostridioides difficile]VFF95035.1 HTH-type transcriptional regulator [Clostridioides difficile]VIG15905.1 HTH-type transcriptional regulator [Clostridioides difficile]HBF4774115.1 helix-turn-helix transcriptional regulator [Clostridioides difficile]HBF5038794.1 helix-turn-helix transcriptional regulator [Clostridioides difficile]HBF5411789.1 helix-turn-helix transcriptional regulator [Clostridioides difficile]
MELDFKVIGQRIKIARIKKKLTQEVLSEKINVSPQHVSNIETGNSSVSLGTLVAIANTLEVSVDELLCDTILSSKAIFENELEEVLRDCNEYEIRFITDIVKASKKSIRDIKLFQSNVNNRY